MSEETFLTAPRRACRYFAIDMNKGGLIAEETERAMSILDRMVRRETGVKINTE